MPSAPYHEPTTNARQDGVVIDCNIKELFYGSFRAVRDTRVPIARNRGTGHRSGRGLAGSLSIHRSWRLARARPRNYRSLTVLRFRVKATDPPASRKAEGAVVKAREAMADARDASCIEQRLKADSRAGWSDGKEKAPKRMNASGLGK
jgi:hypothetical protein